MKLPSTSAFVESLGEGLLVPDGYTVTVDGWGWSGKTPNGLSFRCELEGREPVDISIRSERFTSDGMLAHRVLSAETSRREKIVLPLELRVERVKVRPRVNGRIRVFAGVASGSHAIVVATVGTVAVELEGERAQLDGLALRSVTKKELKALLRHPREQSRKKR